MSEQLVTDATVVRRVPYREADLVLTLVTRDAGKLTALARGARSSRRRFGAALELGVLASVELRGRRGAEMWTLASATTRHHYPLGDVAALAHASYGAELVRELTPVEQPEPVVFELLLELYAALEAHGPRPRVLRRFELGLLAAIGLGPALDACAACGGAPASGAVLDPARGVLCRACAAAARGLGLRPLAEAIRLELVAASNAAGLAIEPLDDDGDVAALTRAATAALVAHHVGKPLKTLEFLAKMSTTSSTAPRT